MGHQGKHERRDKRSRAREGITVTGSGTVEAVPDVVQIELGAQATAPDVQQAIDAATVGLDAARTSLLASGVAPGDLGSAQSSTWTERPDNAEPRTTARLTLRVVVRDVAEAGEAVRQALAAAGAVAQLESMHLRVGDPSASLTKALDRAFGDARAKATQLAGLAGRSLGRVVDVAEGSGGGGGGPRMMAMRADAVGASLGVDAGTQEISATVTVRWAFDGEAP
ncbi:hypothetical protein SAMN05216410_2483 [Sanguibacter gelidistatuariae]|uniref:DUF541 domain-containing protein n=1 Tax=Sanguibacter gelidistatuariae TaxID=1814289 RepID=A0A1G6Q9K3_9MICO|nr:SIMPL domain-containing protein [Sanguibacter gelidistatuariae]SDC89192.1 hypothetical protein SAMN05216410_2483 [Sanguibacter gelidistatuariae]